MKTNEKEMKFTGATPIILAVTIITSSPIIVINQWWKNIFEIHSVSFYALVVSASILLAIGLPFYIYTVKIIKKGFQEGKLLTKGMFSICRNPLFAIVIFLILPGILLLFKSWLLLIIPLLFYIVFHMYIGREEKLLEEKFGNEFLNYKKNTSRIIPIFWKLKK